MSAGNMDSGVRLYSVPVDLSLQGNHCLSFSCCVSRHFWRMDKDILTCNLYLHHPPTHNYPSFHLSFSANAVSHCTAFWISFPHNSESRRDFVLALQRLLVSCGPRWWPFRALSFPPSNDPGIPRWWDILCEVWLEVTVRSYVPPDSAVEHTVIDRQSEGPAPSPARVGVGGPGTQLPIWVSERVAEVASAVHSYQPLFLWLWTVSFP